MNNEKRHILTATLSDTVSERVSTLSTKPLEQVCVSLDELFAEDELAISNEDA